MSATNEWNVWHLTRTGWVLSEMKLDNVGTSQMDPPADRVLSIVFSEYAGSVMSRIERWSRVVWEPADRLETYELLTKHGHWPTAIGTRLGPDDGR